MTLPESTYQLEAISPLPGSGSGWSSTPSSLSRIVTARMEAQ